MTHSIRTFTLLILFCSSGMLTAQAKSTITVVGDSASGPSSLHLAVQSPAIFKTQNRLDAVNLSYGSGGGGSSGGSKGGGCSLSPAADFDPVLLVLIMCALLYLRRPNKRAE